jgi:renalase
VQTIANPEFIQQIESVTFAPSLTAIAAYSPELRSQFTATNLRGITCSDPTIGWIGFDSTKQLNPTQPIIIIQSNAEFATTHFDSTDLPAIAQQLCDRAAEVFDLPAIATPELLQIQRWKYAFALNPINAPVLAATTTAPLFCIGDWCGGNRVESAFLSGLAMAERLA